MIIFGFISSFPVSSQVPFFALHVTRLKCLPLDVSFFCVSFFNKSSLAASSLSGVLGLEGPDH